MEIALNPAKHPRVKHLRVLTLSLFLLLVITGAACGGGKGTQSVTSSTRTAKGVGADNKSLSGTLNGSGSSFQDAFDQRVITAFREAAPHVSVSYTKSGSGAGKIDLQNRVVQFAGTDSLVKAEDKPKFQGGDFLYFPTVAAPITVAYNLRTVGTLQLSAETLAGIFSAGVTTWNDPRIIADNPGVKLPSTPIVVVHRSDASGTTNNFTRFLVKAGGKAWTLGTGDTVVWPTATQGAEKNSGVASVISSTEGSVGYVDLADAVNAGLHQARVKNRQGAFVAPTLAGAAAAIKGSVTNDDLTYDPVNSGDAEAYPITSPTWIIVYKKQTDPTTTAAIKGFLAFMLGDGQRLAETVGYARIPTSLANRAIAQLDQITTG